jgi:TonB family protein
MQAERHVQGETDLSIPLQRAGVKRSFGLDSISGNESGASSSLRFGIFVGKDTTFPQPQPPDVTVQQNDVLQRAATSDQGNGESSFVIEGPASERKVSYKPPRLPELQIDFEVTIRLKFWVLPDGTVGEVIPLQRGDVRLERAAIQYLKSWRFTPVSKDKPMVWGIMPIKYQLK